MDKPVEELEADLEEVIKKYFSKLRPAEVVSALESVQHEFIKEAMGL